MKIATYNVNGIRSRLSNLVEWLKREQPDVACLQELKAADNQFPTLDLRAIGYEAIWHGQAGFNGVAILAKGEKPRETRRGLPGDPDDTHSRYIEAAIDGLIVGCLYLPNGNPQPGPKFDYKLKWFERFMEHAQKLYDSRHPVVLCGDYNVVPTDELDIYNPKSWKKDALLQPATRECWKRLLAQGWTDALRAHVGDEKVYTFWDYFREHWPRNAGLRIDHLLLSDELKPRMRAAGVDRWVRGQPHASDHAPTWVELDVGRPSGRRSPEGQPTSASTKSSRSPRATKAAPRRSPRNRA